MTTLIAFLAPEAPPTASAITGARHMARLVVTALRRAGCDVRLAARLAPGTDFADPRGSRLNRIAARLAARLARRIESLAPEARPEAIATLRVSGGAPDLIGPALARATGLPRVAIHAGAARGGAGADEDDPGRVVVLGAAAGGNPPLFVDTAQYGMPLPNGMRAPFRAMVGASHGLDPGVPWIVVAAMMDRPRKVESFRMLAAALARLAGRPWQLAVAGDGPHRMAVAETLFPLGPERVRLMGTMVGGDLAALYRAADLCAWPALDEPLALACLEAQASEVPVVACGGGGAATFVRDGETGYLVAPGDAAGFADRIATLLDDAAARRRMGRAARDNAVRHHDIERAAAALARSLAAATAAPPAHRDGS